MIDLWIKNNRGYFIESNFVSRNFLIGDRAKIRWEGNWYPGEVIDKYFINPKCHSDAPYIIVKTDDKVYQVRNKNDNLNGHGLKCRADGWDILFEKEKNSGNKMYHKTARRRMTVTEIEEYNEPLPF